MDAVVYARFSCSKQREESIEDQERVCRAHAAARGWRVRRVYADRAVSATTDARPQFRRMLADAERGTFQRVIVYKLDRFARNRYDAAVNRARLRRCGVELVSATESIGDGPEGVLVESLLEGLAEYYSRQLSENVRRGIEGNAMRCRANGRTVYGYDIVDGEYQVNEAEAAVVRRMFDVVAQGGTVSDAIRAIDGTRTRGGNRWRASTVCRMLRSERYRGVYSYAGHRQEGGMPRIVDDATWEAVQAHFSRSGHPHAGSAAYPLSGKLVDPEGRAYVGTSGTGRRGGTYHYYRSPEGKLWPRDALDARVAGAVAVALSSPESVDAVADLVMEGQAAASESQRAVCEAMECDLRAANSEYDKLVEAAVKLGVDGRLKARVDAVRERIADLEASLAWERSQLPTVTRDMVAFWVRSIAEAPDVETLLGVFVSAVVMDADGGLRVAFLLDNCDKPPAEARGLYEFRMVDSAGVRANPRVYAVPGGFVVAA
jgi:DNA invertase Pin-like site-specific DNA recombinase